MHEFYDRGILFYFIIKLIYFCGNNTPVGIGWRYFIFEGPQPKKPKNKVLCLDSAPSSITHAHTNAVGSRRWRLS